MLKPGEERHVKHFSLVVSVGERSLVLYTQRQRPMLILLAKDEEDIFSATLPRTPVTGSIIHAFCDAYEANTWVYTHPFFSEQPYGSGY